MTLDFHILQQKLDRSFYLQEDVVSVAEQLLGKILVTQIGNVVTAGRIVETEAYAGPVDRASHAWNGRRTARTEIMYAIGGTAYVYLCYGIHHLFNVVTNVADMPHAVLIRAIEPLVGIDEMLLRTKRVKPDYTFTRGPGNVSKALGIQTVHTGLDLLGDVIWIAHDDKAYAPSDIVATPRIGVDYAGEDASLLYRFMVKGGRGMKYKI